MEQNICYSNKSFWLKKDGKLAELRQEHLFLYWAEFHHLYVACCLSYWTRPCQVFQLHGTAVPKIGIYPEILNRENLIWKNFEKAVQSVHLCFCKMLKSLVVPLSGSKSQAYLWNKNLEIWFAIKCRGVARKLHFAAGTGQAGVRQRVAFCRRDK